MSVAACSCYFYFVYRPDWQTRDTVASHVIEVAREGAETLLSYSPDTLGRDFENAKSRVTENYLPYYERFVDQIVGPAAQRAGVTTQARVLHAALTELQPKTAVVLLFVEQKTSTREKPEQVVTRRSPRVTLVKVGDAWLIDKLESG